MWVGLGGVVDLMGSTGMKMWEVAHERGPVEGVWNI
jgi:hypothetical protein